jgi:hypothetical protein
MKAWSCRYAAPCNSPKMPRLPRIHPRKISVNQDDLASSSHPVMILNLGKTPLALDPECTEMIAPSSSQFELWRLMQATCAQFPRNFPTDDRATQMHRIRGGRAQCPGTAPSGARDGRNDGLKMRNEKISPTFMSRRSSGLGMKEIITTQLFDTSS